MIRILATIFAALLGLAFGSFLNVCISRWPTGESVITPRSHCRNCTHALSWWENIPLLSWLFLRGRCRNCHTRISIRYPLVELAIGGLWAQIAWTMLRTTSPGIPPIYLFENRYELAGAIASVIFSWLLVALAALDAEHLWLPDWLTWPGIVLGFLVTVIRTRLLYGINGADARNLPIAPGALKCLLSILAAAALILFIRWVYKLIRHHEGIGLGDVKLMALLAAWLGLPEALLAFTLGTVFGAAISLVLFALPSVRTNPKSWATSKLPLGTFLCMGGIVSSLWGQSIIAAYLRWAGF